MKKLFSIFAATMFAASMMATGTVFTYSDKVSDQTKDGFTVKLAKGKGDNEPKATENYNTKKWEVRLYAKNTITVSGKGITRVDLTFSKQGSKDYASLSASKGNLKSGGESTASDDKKVDTWTGSADEVVFTIGDKGQRIIYQIVVNGDGSEGGGEGEGGEGEGGEGEGGEGGEGEGGEEEGSYTYDYEPAKTTINMTMKYADWTDYTAEDAMVVLYLSDAENADPDKETAWAELAFWTNTPDEKLGVPAGTYQINDTEHANTFMASPGMNEETFYDVPCYLGANYDAETEDYDSYYLVSGTVYIAPMNNGVKIEVNATSYNGSTVKLLYEGAISEYIPEEEEAIENINVDSDATLKVMHDGQMYIIRDKKAYNMVGARVK